MDPITIAALVSGAGSLLGGLLGSSAADKAAKAQAASADKALALQDKMYTQTRADSLPWLAAGKTALSQYMGELGLSKTGADGKPFESQFQKTPGYDFQVQQGEQGVTNNLAALGMKNSGAALKALTKFRTGLADQTYGAYLDRVGGVAGQGQQQANQNSANAANAANSMSGLITDAGAARASGYVGQANSWNNAISGITNTAGSWLGSKQGTGSGASLRSGTSALGGAY